MPEARETTEDDLNRRSLVLPLALLAGGGATAGTYNFLKQEVFLPNEEYEAIQAKIGRLEHQQRTLEVKESIAVKEHREQDAIEARQKMFRNETLITEKKVELPDSYNPGLDELSSFAGAALVGTLVAAGLYKATTAGLKKVFMSHHKEIA